MSDEWKKNISNGKKGVKFSEKHLKNLSISHKGQISNLIKPVYQININNGQILNKFNSITKALKYLNVDLNSGSISEVCKGKLTSTYGYYWCYVDNYNEYKYQKYKRSNQRNILQYDKNGILVKEYDTIYDASQETGLDRDGISHALSDESSCSGYLWFYKDEFNLDKLKYKLSKIKKNISFNK